MPFHRVWDASCPREYDRWEADGVSWVIQDLDPADDEEALKMLLDIMSTEETLCVVSEISKDMESMREMGEFWRVVLSKRMSLGCYATKDGFTELVALNACLAFCRGEEQEVYPIGGEAWTNVYGGLEHVERKADPFEYLGLDTLLFAFGLVVRTEYRGARLGARVLAARKPLAVSQGMKGSATVFTGAASQRSAERAGFTEIARSSISELAKDGLRYPKDDHRVIKFMVKRYDAE